LSWLHTSVERTNFMFISLFAPNKRTKEKAPSSLAYGSPRETQEHGGVKNSSRFSRDLDSLPPLIRILTLRSAALQRVLKPKTKKNLYFRSFEFVLRVFPSERSRDGCLGTDQDEKLFEPCKGEFLSFPLASARRGQPMAAKRQDVLSWGYPFFGQAKKGYKIFF